MNAVRSFDGIHLIAGLGLAVSLVATGILFYLLALHYQVKKRAGEWIGENPSPRRRGLKKNIFGRGRGKNTFLKIYAQRGIQWFCQILYWHEERLIKSGMTSEKAVKLSKKWCIFMFGIGLFLLARDLSHPEVSVLFFLTLMAYFWLMTGSRIKERKNTFVTGVYKIYRHMALQLSSGMSSAEAIKYLHESVEEPFLKEAMYRFSSCYFKTMDLDLSLGELTRRIEGDEVQVLATVLRQGLQTGDSYEMIIKQEQLMVKRYYAALSAESERIRTKGILIAIGLCILIFILLAAPMVYEMGRATQSIFSGQ